MSYPQVSRGYRWPCWCVFHGFCTIRWPWLGSSLPLPIGLLFINLVTYHSIFVFIHIHSAMFSFFELLRCPRRCHVDPQTWLQLCGSVNGPCHWSTTLQTPAFLSTVGGCHQLSLLYFDLLDLWGQEPRRKRSHQHILRLEQFRYQVAGFIRPISGFSHPNFYLVFTCSTWSRSQTFHQKPDFVPKYLWQGARKRDGIDVP